MKISVSLEEGRCDLVLLPEKNAQYAMVIEVGEKGGNKEIGRAHV